MIKTGTELRQELARVQRNKLFFAMQLLKSPTNPETKVSFQKFESREVEIKEWLGR